MYPRLIVGIFALIFGFGQTAVITQKKAYYGIFAALTAVAGRAFSYAAAVYVSVYVGKVVRKTVEFDIFIQILFGIILHICHHEKKRAFVQFVLFFFRARGKRKDKYCKQYANYKPFLHFAFLLKIIPKR